MSYDILDDTTPEAFVPASSQRITWYFKHTALIIILTIIIATIIIRVFPILSDSIKDFVIGTTFASMMLGMFGITLYVYIKGLKWSIKGGLLGSIISFIFCFIYLGENLYWLHFYYNLYFGILFYNIDPSLKEDFIETIIVGVSYNVLTIACTELMVWINFAFKAVQSWFQKDSKS